MHIVLLKCPHVQIAFLKFTSYDNRDLVGCNCCCSCSFEREIIKIGQSSHKMYSNNILNFQESTTILMLVKNVWKLIVCTSYIIHRLSRNFFVLFAILKQESIIKNLRWKAKHCQQSTDINIGVIICYLFWPSDFTKEVGDVD